MREPAPSPSSRPFRGVPPESIPMPTFLDLGVPAPLPSWGLMVAEGKAQILFDPWLVTIPGVMLLLLVLSINLLGDALRDVTTPGATGR